MDKIYEEVAHDSEVLCLTYSKEIDGRPTNYIVTNAEDWPTIKDLILFLCCSKRTLIISANGQLLFLALPMV